MKVIINFIIFVFGIPLAFFLTRYFFPNHFKFLMGIKGNFLLGIFLFILNEIHSPKSK